MNLFKVCKNNLLLKQVYGNTINTTRLSSWSKMSSVACRNNPIAALFDFNATARVNLIQARSSTTSFFTRGTADDLWKSTTSVSNAGKKRGRGKGAGRKTVKDLNRGQRIGLGRINMVWPGLNAPIIQGKEKVEMKKLPSDDSYMENLIRQRNEMDVYKKRVVHPLERGWSGISVVGRALGPPDPVHGESFDGFMSTVINVSNRLHMTANLGKQRLTTVTSVVGNKNGCVGYAFSRAKDGRAALRNSINKAGQRLRHFELHNGHTITHDFYSRFGAYKVFAFKKPPGYGVVAHRAIKAVCDVAGIKDIYVKTEGPIKKKNYLAAIRAFIVGLENQKTYQQLADEKKLHLVEFSEDRDFLPVVVASPSDGTVRTKNDIHSEEVLDFRMHIYDGQVKVPKPPKLPAYTRGDGYAHFLQYYHYWRPRQNNRVYMKATYGTVDSFLTIREKRDREQRKLLLSKEESEETSAETLN